MRRYTRIPAWCITTLILAALLVASASAVHITYQVFDDGSGYRAVGLVNSSDRFDFIQSGMMGERVPLAVTNVSLHYTRNGTNATFTTEREGIRFPTGNYTVGFEGKITGNAFQTLYTEPVNASVILPDRFRVDNPLLTSLQPGSANITRNQNQTTIRWDKVRYLDIRFFDANQENLLNIFGQFWLIIAVVLLLPFILSRDKP